MKKLLSLLSFSLLLLTGNSYAQYSYQDINSQLVNKSIGAIASDNSGNVIVTGGFATTIAFGSTILANVNTEGSSAGFIAKLDPNGIFSWAKCINLPNTGGISVSQVDIRKVVTDAAGYIYIIGSYSGTIKLDNISLSSNKNSQDLFTVKMSPAGVFLWARSEGTGDDVVCPGEKGNSVSTDNQGNVYSTGSIISKVFKNSSACYCGPNKRVYAIYVVKYNSSGTKLWEKKYSNSLETATSPCDHDPIGFDIKSDGSNVYIAGRMYGSINFGNVTLNTGSNTIANAILLKLDGNGNTLWVRSVTNANNSDNISGVDVMLDNNNNEVYLIGNFSNGTINFGGPSLTWNSSPLHTYIAKYSPSGICSWASDVGGTYIMRHHSVKHPDGNLAAFVTGYNLPNPFTLKECSTTNGAIVDSTVASVYTAATDVVTLPGGFVYAQNLKGSYDFGGITITSTQPTTSDYSDMILVKYGSVPPPMVHPTGVASVSSPSAMALYPNPATNHITIANSPDQMLGTISIFDISGKMIFQQKFTTSEAKIDVTDFAPGLYFVKSDELHEQLKFVRQ